MSSTVFPGQNLTPFLEEKSKSLNSDEPVKIQVGPGIIQNGNEVIAFQAGILNCQKSKFSLKSSQKHYIPLQNDLIIGIITARLSELFRVDIGAQTMAVLPLLTGFEGSTKKNRPNWNAGTAIFARVSMAHPDLEPELSCFDPSGKIPSDLFGELGGSENIFAETKANLRTSNLLRTSCNFSRKLQNPLKDPLLSLLGRIFAFEIAAGANGKIFLETENPRESVEISRLIIEYERKLDLTEIEKLVKELVKTLGKDKIK
jgi:exosome complex component RRP40